jgi:glutamate 5-kinase
MKNELSLLRLGVTSLLTDKETAVVKFGTGLVTTEAGINQDAINDYAAGLVQQYEGQRLVVVTSGAIATGKALVARMGRDLADYQRVTLAQIGASRMMNAWEQAFEEVDVIAGGLFVTHHEIETRDEGRVFKGTLGFAGDTDTVCVLNHNDALSYDEIFKDNDKLSVHIAKAIGAKSLTLFTKQGGVMDGDKQLIERVTSKNIAEINDMLAERAALDGEGGEGTGGIQSKNEVGWEAALAGIYCRIAAVNEDMSGARVTEYMVG